jgi:hypothetical protein
VTEAATAGVRTFVLGTSALDAAEQSTLTALAVAGGEANAGTPRYHTAGNRQKFQAALTQIAARTTMCVFNLEAAPPSPADVALLLDGKRLAPDSTQREGWTWGADNRSVQIYGAACEALKSKTMSVEMVFGCRGVPVP